MRGGREDRGPKTLPEKTCIQCGETFTPSKADHSCVRCSGCRSFRNGAVPVQCGRCGIKLQINASMYYSRIKPSLSVGGIYTCSPCLHTMRARITRAAQPPKTVDTSLRETMEAPCGTIYRTFVGQRCEITWTQEGYCEHYIQCRDVAARLGWPGWRKVDDPPEKLSRREFYLSFVLDELELGLAGDSYQQKSGRYA